MNSFHVPVDISYTYTRAEVTEDNPVSGLREGDRLKDVPENQFSVRSGLEHVSGWNNYVIAKYIDEMCVVAGCESNASAFDKTESLLVVDFVSRYQLRPQTEVFMKVANVFDEQKIVSRLPDGARPNEPQTVSLGMKHMF
jgi:Fe(3+) dicitrate transport protein